MQAQVCLLASYFLFIFLSSLFYLISSCFFLSPSDILSFFNIFVIFPNILFLFFFPELHINGNGDGIELEKFILTYHLFKKDFELMSMADCIFQRVLSGLPSRKESTC